MQSALSGWGKLTGNRRAGSSPYVKYKLMLESLEFLCQNFLPIRQQMYLRPLSRSIEIKPARGKRKHRRPDGRELSWLRRRNDRAGRAAHLALWSWAASIQVRPAPGAQRRQTRPSAAALTQEQAPFLILTICVCSEHHTGNVQKLVFHRSPARRPGICSSV